MRLHVEMQCGASRRHVWRLLNGEVNTASFIEVEDEKHEMIETVSFADVVKLRNERHSRQADQS